MDKGTGNDIDGSMTGTKTNGARLVPAPVGNGLYTDGHANFGNHHSEFCQNPDVCAVPFSVWIKEGIGTDSGLTMDTGESGSMQKV